MSGENSLARGGRAAEPQTREAEFGIPPEVADRYEVRGVDGSGGEQRLGLFRPGQRDVPVIEIDDSGDANRIVARSEDADTVRALVQIAQHNGWDRVDVDGSPEFRKAIWTAASHAGLKVSGYEPTFAEREQVAAARPDAEGRATQTAAPAAPTSADIGPMTETTPRPGRTATNTAPAAWQWPDLSEGDDRLLLRISALTEDRHRLVETLEMDMPRLAREVQVERVGENRDALVTALDRALESPSLAKSFDRAGYAAEDLRGMATANEWDRGVADAVYLVRTGLHRDTMRQDRADGRSPAELASEPRDRGGARVAYDPASPGGAEARPPAETPDRADRERSAGGEELAELFLHGSPERVAADPRLLGAVQAQTVMEQHISEVFGGDATRLASANLESRHLISDVLRRGMDVSVREPTPVRQMEPMQALPELER